jgi:hypothetical protein
MFPGSPAIGFRLQGRPLSRRASLPRQIQGDQPIYMLPYMILDPSVTGHHVDSGLLTHLTIGVWLIRSVSLSHIIAAIRRCYMSRYLLSWILGLEVGLLSSPMLVG